MEEKPDRGQLSAEHEKALEGNRTDEKKPFRSARPWVSNSDLCHDFFSYGGPDAIFGKTIRDNFEM